MVAATRRDVRPVAVDQVHVHLAADQRAQVLRDARAVEHMAAFGRQVADARDERVAEQRVRGEDQARSETLRMNSSIASSAYRVRTTRAKLRPTR